MEDRRVHDPEHAQGDMWVFLAQPPKGLKDSLRKHSCRFTVEEKREFHELYYGLLFDQLRDRRRWLFVFFRDLFNEGRRRTPDGLDHRGRGPGLLTLKDDSHRRSHKHTWGED